MKRIINGRKYDTETAQKAGEWENCVDSNNFHYCHETLYRKVKGEFFLHGEGHAMSRYRKCDADGTRYWGATILPLSEGEAREWAEEHLSGDSYEELFGEVEE
ncbi:MAG: hypothetical protein Q4A01_04225 [Coriobacteriales bacterium]|nr:hypothetical protein [Coriobacteriales bacterium]